MGYEIRLDRDGGGSNTIQITDAVDPYNFFVKYARVTFNGYGLTDQNVFDHDSNFHDVIDWVVVGLSSVRIHYTIKKL